MATEMDTGAGSSSLLFLLSGLCFLGSVLLFCYDLATGNAVIRGLVVNAASAAVIIVLAGWETLASEESSIATRFDAVRAVLFFYSIYLLLAGGIVAVVGTLFHPDPRTGLVAVGVGVAGSLLVFVTGESGSDTADWVSTALGLLGLLLFVGSVGLFVYDLATEQSVFRGIAVNAVGAALFILWSAYDMPSDPDSAVESYGDAAGISLLFYGVYLLVAGLVIVGTVVFDHTYGGLGLWYVGLGAVTTVLGFVLAPRDALSSGMDSTEEERTEPTRSNKRED